MQVKNLVHVIKFEYIILFCGKIVIDNHFILKPKILLHLKWSIWTKCIFKIFQ